MDFSESCQIDDIILIAQFLALGCRRCLASGCKTGVGPGHLLRGLHTGNMNYQYAGLHVGVSGVHVLGFAQRCAAPWHQLQHSAHVLYSSSTLKAASQLDTTM